MNEVSRVIRRKYEFIRDAFENEGTRVCPVPAFSQPPSLEDAYLEAYSRLRELCLEHRKDGLLVVALGGADEPHGSVWLMAKETEVNTAIVGRHTMSDLFLPVDPLLSLRHLAILVLPRPRSDGSGVHFRILDLRSTVGFHNEDGHSLSAIDADGLVFIRCGSVPLVAFPTPSPETLWPRDGKHAWERIPPRAYLEARMRSSTAGSRHRRDMFPRGPSSGRPEETLVFTSEGPVQCDLNLLGEREPAVGQLHLESEAGRETITVGRRAARQGIIVGRYERCDNDVTMLLPDCGAVSRVHVLLLEVRGVMYAIDTASTNGIHDGSRKVRVLPLTTGRTLSLAGGLARLEWRPAH